MPKVNRKKPIFFLKLHFCNLGKEISKFTHFPEPFKEIQCRVADREFSTTYYAFLYNFSTHTLNFIHMLSNSNRV